MFYSNTSVNKTKYLKKIILLCEVLRRSDLLIQENFSFENIFYVL